jgi:beta-D-xylosidase 4
MQRCLKVAAFGSILLTVGSLAQDDFKCTGAGNITEYHAKIKNLGCWTDSTTRTLSGKSSSSALNSPQYCADYCGNMGFKYSGVEYTTSASSHQTTPRQR